MFLPRSMDCQMQPVFGLALKAIIKKDVKLNKTQLKKVFGDPKEFNAIGIVFNTEGNYIIVSDGVKYNFATLEEV